MRGKRKHMNKNIKIKTGETNVKLDDAMSVMNVNMIDMTNAGTARNGKGEWNDFELLGESDRKEGEYETVIDEAEFDQEKFRRRMQNARLGKRIMIAARF